MHASYYLTLSCSLKDRLSLCGMGGFEVSIPLAGLEPTVLSDRNTGTCYQVCFPPGVLSLCGYL